MKTEFECVYCWKWIDKTDFDGHMMWHDQMNHDLGFMPCPKNWEEFIRRFTAVGLTNIREVNENGRLDNSD